MSSAAKPIPVPDESSAQFWASAAQHVLAMQQCAACGEFAYPPRISCLSCRADPPAFSWQPVSGFGRVKTWTVMRSAFLPGFVDDIPYVVADIELDEQPGLRMAARLRNVAAAEIRIGMPVQVAFDSVDDGVSIPYFVARES